jgi:hypothetical protein
MHTTNGKWVVSLLWSLDFIKAKVEKQGSSSTLPTTCTIASSTNFTYSRKLETRIQDVVTRHHILVRRFVSKGGGHACVTFDFIVNLNMPCWHSRSFAFKSSST